MVREASDEKFLDALNRIIIVARIMALTDGNKTDIASFLDQADFLLSYYLDLELDVSTIRRVMTKLAERAPNYREYLLGEKPSTQTE